MQALQAYNITPPSITIAFKIEKNRIYWNWNNKHWQSSTKYSVWSIHFPVQLTWTVWKNSTVGLHQHPFTASMWTWCTFTMWDLFEIENLIWNCTFCLVFFYLSTFDTFSVILLTSNTPVFFLRFVFVFCRGWVKQQLFAKHRKIVYQFKYDAYVLTENPFSNLFNITLKIIKLIS